MCRLCSRAFTIFAMMALMATSSLAANDGVTFNSKPTTESSEGYSWKTYVFGTAALVALYRFRVGILHVMSWGVRHAQGKDS